MTKQFSCRGGVEDRKRFLIIVLERFNLGIPVQVGNFKIAAIPADG